VAEMLKANLAANGHPPFITELIIVVLPHPDGAENNIALPMVNIIVYNLMVAGSVKRLVFSVKC
jgi:hypothetical protein